MNVTMIKKQEEENKSKWTYHINQKTSPNIEHFSKEKI